MRNPYQDAFLPLTSIASGEGIEAADDVYALTLQIVNLCFIGKTGEDPNEPYVLIDAAMPHSAEAILEVVKRRYGGRKPQAVILTHGHFDHVGAIVPLLEQWGVPVYAHPAEMPYLNGQKDYPKGDPTVEGGLVSELSPLYPNQGIDIGEWLQALPEDGTVPFLAGWRWIHTPGHTPGHISLFREADRVLIAGDAFVTVKQESLYKVIMQEPEISGPPKYFTSDWEAARASVSKLADLKPAVAVTGHGKPMRGEQLERELSRLVGHFDEIGMPSLQI